MTAEFRVQDPNYGQVCVFAIRVLDTGEWEKEWEPLREAQHHIVDLISPVSHLAYTELLHRHARPFLTEVGLPPKACLLKFPLKVGKCYYMKSCKSYDKASCHVAAKNTPPCFDVSVDDPRIRVLISRLVDWWKNDFYVVLIMPEDAL